MTEDVVIVVNEMGKQEGIPDGIQFHNIHHKSATSDLYADIVGHKDSNSCASDKEWKDRKNPEDNWKNLVSNMAVDDNDVNDLVNDLNNEDTIHLNEVKGFVIDRV